MPAAALRVAAATAAETFAAYRLMPAEFGKDAAALIAVVIVGECQQRTAHFFGFCPGFGSGPRNTCPGP